MVGGGGDRQWAPVGEVGEGWGTDMWGPGYSTGRRRPFDSKNRIQSQTGPNHVQIVSKFNGPKKDLRDLRKIEIKYVSEDLEKMNNFIHRNFF
jgi:hypothetical protein